MFLDVFEWKIYLWRTYKILNERETWYGLRNNNPKEVKSDINSLVTVVEKLESNNLDMISNSLDPLNPLNWIWILQQATQSYLCLSSSIFIDRIIIPILRNFKSSDEKHHKTLEQIMMSFWYAYLHNWKLFQNITSSGFSGRWQWQENSCDEAFISFLSFHAWYTIRTTKSFAIIPFPICCSN